MACAGVDDQHAHREAHRRRRCTKRLRTSEEESVVSVEVHPASRALAPRNAPR